jgi:hypothetical protein
MPEKRVPAKAGKELRGRQRVSAQKRRGTHTQPAMPGKKDGTPGSTREKGDET